MRLRFKKQCWAPLALVAALLKRKLSQYPTGSGFSWHVTGGESIVSAMFEDIKRFLAEKGMKLDKPEI
jgi:hypothetical protein